MFIDFQKAFDRVNHEFMLYKLREAGITGNIYKAVKAMYSGPSSCVNLNGNLTDWFPVSSGVQQGDTLSPTLFSIFIDDLATQIKDAIVGIQVNPELSLSILLYADDIVVLSKSRDDYQKQLDIITSWCRRWGMAVNTEKSQVMHVRNHQRPRCDRDLYLDHRELQYVSSYKYLGCWIHEFLSNDRTVEALTAAAGRSFGRIVNIFKYMGDMGYETYCTLYHSYILLVANYGAAVWGFKDCLAPQVLQNRIMRFFLGVHHFAPLPMLWTEMDCMNIGRQGGSRCSDI